MARASAFLRRFGDDRAGASTVMVGLGAIVLLGAAGLATDVAGWYAARRGAQHAADSAAYSAAVSMSDAAADYAGQGKAVAGAYGLRDGQNGAKVTVRKVAAADGGDAVEVVVEQPARRFFSRLFMVDARTIKARALARVAATGDGCVLALNRSDPETAAFSGAAGVALNGCALIANSTSAEGLSLGGASSLSAQNIILGGAAYELNGAARLTATDGVAYRHAPIADPYADFEPPPFSGCDQNGRHVTGVEDVTFPPSGVAPARPYVFCNGLKIDGASRVKFLPGVYVIDRGAFNVEGAASVEARGVTFILTSSTGTDHATADIRGASSLTILAPTTGPTAGLAVVQSRRAPASRDVNRINGAAAMNVRGAIYFPNQTVEYTGAAATRASCLVLVADKVSFSGSAGFALNCAGLGVKPPGGASAVLVE